MYLMLLYGRVVSSVKNSWLSETYMVPIYGAGRLGNKNSIMYLCWYVSRTRMLVRTVIAVRNGNERYLAKKLAKTKRRFGYANRVFSTEKNQLSEQK